MVLVKKKGNFYRAVIKLFGILFFLFVGSRQHASAFPNLPTWSGFPRFAGAHVGVALLAKPLSFAELRQHAPAFSGLPVPVLASTSSQSPYPSPNRANTPWVFPICRRLCWRRPLRKAFVLRRATPTRPGFSRPAGVFVGVDLLAKPLPFVEPSPTPKSIEPEICVIQNERKTALPISSRSFFTKIRSCRNYSAITVPTQALPVHAALPSSVSR